MFYSYTKDIITKSQTMLIKLGNQCSEHKVVPNVFHLQKAYKHNHRLIRIFNGFSSERKGKM